MGVSATDFRLAVEQGLLEGRALAEALMTSTCIITKDGDGEPEFDNGTGQYEDPDRVTVYEGKCRVQVRGDRTGSSEFETGDREVSTHEPELQLPIAGTGAVSVDQQAKILTNPLDDSLVDRVFTIVGRLEKTHATMRRLRVVEVTG